MRLTAAALGLTVLATSFAVAPALAAKPTAQSTHCNAQAKSQGLVGHARSEFVRSCVKGPLAPATPTGPTAASKEAQAVTKPSGVDRTTRAAQCNEEADRKHLAAKERKAFQLSCLATAGPVSEGETGTKQPHPANQINGIGENNYKPSATTAKSKPEPSPPAAAKPQR